MKELTTEQKAQRYDEAIEKLHEIITMDNRPVNPKEIGSYLFPELKSEDEKIRKHLLYHFRNKTKKEWNGMPVKDILVWLEKQGEQKPADKPKFKVGDWVIGRATSNEPRQISEITDQCYKSTYGGQYGFSFEEDMHLWTIQDAKDGDVLVASDGSIFIFKGAIDCACKHYVALTTDDVVKFNEGLEHYWETVTAVHPATKEQRDLLFKKMHEAGYEWDAEKKELKKIEQKPAWSEEDMKRIDHIISFMEDKDRVKDTERLFPIEEDVRWLKSIKDRIIPQPKQEWSEEDKKIIIELIGIFESAVDGEHE